jgi:HEAT repeat protein
MRITLLFTVPFVLLLWIATPTLSQKQGTKPGPKKGETPDESSEGTLIGGKTVDRWIKDLKSGDASVRQRALQAIPMFGPKLSMKALPLVLQQLSSPDVGVRVNAAIAVGIMLSVAHPDDDEQIRKVVLALKARLKDDETIVRYRVAEALISLGREAHDCVELLCGQAREPASRGARSTWEMRRAACLALGATAFDPKHGPELKAIEALTWALYDSCLEVRLAAMQALVALGPPREPPYKARDALQTVLSRLEKRATPGKGQVRDEGEQIWAQVTIMRLSEITDERLARIGKFLLPSSEPAVRCQAAQALGLIGKKARPQVPNLMAALSDKEDEVVGSCLVALGAIGRDAVAALTRIEQIAKEHKNPAVKSAANEAARLIRGMGKQAALKP